MDALSDVLKPVRLEGAVFLDAEFSAPWCLRGTPYRIKAIALDAGHESAAACHRAFVREYGTTPAAWRRGGGAMRRGTR